jgi:hypothetical protein
LIIAFVLLAVVGCKKHSNENKKEEQRIENEYNLGVPISEIKLNYEKIRNASSVQEAKVIFNTFSHKEASAVWKYRLILVKESDKYTKEQNEVFDFCINRLSSVDLYSKLQTDEVQSIEEMIMLCFSESLGYKIFCTFDDIVIAKTVGGGGPSYCECSTESDWCGAFESGSNRSVCVAQSNCGGGVGCGTLWRYSCGGRCMIRMN